MSFSVFMKSFASALQFFCLPSAILSSLALVFLYLLFSWGIRKASQATESEEAGAPGCLTSILMILFQAFVVGFFVLLNLSLLINVRSHFSEPDWVSLGYLAIRGGLFAALAALLISLIPKLGKFFNASPGLEFFVLCGISFHIQAPFYLSQNTEVQSNIFIFRPGLKVDLIYLFLTIIATRLAALLLFLFLKLVAVSKIDFYLKYVGPTLDLAIGLFFFVACSQYLIFALY